METFTVMVCVCVCVCVYELVFRLVSVCSCTYSSWSTKLTLRPTQVQTTHTKKSLSQESSSNPLIIQAIYGLQKEIMDGKHYDHSAVLSIMSDMKPQSLRHTNNLGLASLAQDMKNVHASL